MGCVSKIFATGDEDLERRKPIPFDGIEVNFCRNPSFGVIPDEYKRPSGSNPAPVGVIRGAVKGKKNEEFFDCPNFSWTARLKNNTTIVAEYRRHKVLRETDPAERSCQTAGCFAQGCSPRKHPEFYWKFSKTAGGDPHWRCRLCRSTFSEGKVARRHKRSDKNRLVFQMLCNGLPLSKIEVVAEFRPNC